MKTNQLLPVFGKVILIPQSWPQFWLQTFASQFDLTNEPFTKYWNLIEWGFTRQSKTDQLSFQSTESGGSWLQTHEEMLSLLCLLHLPGLSLRYIIMWKCEFWLCKSVKSESKRLFPFPVSISVSPVRSSSLHCHVKVWKCCVIKKSHCYGCSTCQVVVFKPSCESVNVWNHEREKVIMPASPVFTLSKPSHDFHHCPIVAFPSSSTSSTVCQFQNSCCGCCIESKCTNKRGATTLVI